MAQRKPAMEESAARPQAPWLVECGLSGSDEFYRRVDYLGLQESFVEIPACPPLRCPATRQPAVYALAVGAATLFAGWRVLVAAAALYVFNVRDAS